ncbi:MAG: tetratricopeptide repeat protein [Acidobacteria bacterium]|nr:tetratricopeptide repeat protein [Acidobacteriota bacterium]
MSRIILVTLLAGALASAACSTEAAKRSALARGNSYYAEGKFTEAILEFRRAVQLDPQWGEARRRLSEAYLKNNTPRAALQELVRAADLLPQDSELQLLVGNFMLMAGRFEDARARAELVLAREPTNAAAQVMRGNAMMGLKDFGAALEEMEAALTNDPDRALTLANVGVVQLMRGDAIAAGEAFDNAVKAEPKSPLIRLALASYLISSGRAADAEEQLKEAYSLAPDEAVVNRALAVFYVRLGQNAEAEPYLKWLAQNSEDVTIKFSLARLYVATRRPNDALELLKGLTGDPVSAAEARVQMAAILFGNGRRPEAYQQIDAILKQANNNARALLLKASFLLEEDKLDESILAAQAATKADADLTQAYYVMGLAYSQQREVEKAQLAFNEVLRLEPRAFEAQLALSRLYLETGNIDLALELAGNASVKAPNAPAVREAIIRASLARGNLARAENEVRALIAQYPKRATGHVLQGDLNVAQKNLTAAERAYRAAIDLVPQSPAANLGLVKIDIARGRRRAAIEQVNQMVENGKDNTDVLLLAARSYVTLNEWGQAERVLRTALATEPQNFEAYGLLGSLYLLQGKLDGALKEFQTAASHDPESVVAHTMTGIIYERQQRRADAKEAYRRALAAEPKAFVAANNLAWLMAEDNESFDKALELARNARLGMPNSADVTDTIGWIYYRWGLHALAIEELKEAVRRQPSSAAFTYHLGLAYAKNGDQALAKQTLESALKMDPRAPEARDARAALAQLGNKS